jgi:cell division protein ZapA
VTTVKIGGREYRLRSADDPERAERAAEYVDHILREIQASSPDTHDAAILTALNIASELLRLRQSMPPPERMRALIDLIDSV